MTLINWRDLDGRDEHINFRNTQKCFHFSVRQYISIYNNFMEVLFANAISCG